MRTPITNVAIAEAGWDTTQRNQNVTEIANPYGRALRESHQPSPFPIRTHVLPSVSSEQINILKKYHKRSKERRREARHGRRAQNKGNDTNSVDMVPVSSWGTISRQDSDCDNKRVGGAPLRTSLDPRLGSPPNTSRLNPPKHSFNSTRARLAACARHNRQGFIRLHVSHATDTNRGAAPWAAPRRVFRV